MSGRVTLVPRPASWLGHLMDYISLARGRKVKGKGVVSSVLLKEKSQGSVQMCLGLQCPKREKEEPSDESVPMTPGRKNQLPLLAVRPDPTTVGLP